MINIDTCENPNVLNIILISSKILKVILFVIPIILIIVIIKEFIKALTNGDLDKDSKDKIISKVIATIVIFLVPTFVKIFTEVFISNVYILNTYARCVANTENIDYFQEIYDKAVAEEEAERQRQLEERIAKNKLLSEANKVKSGDYQSSPASKHYKIILNPSHQIHNETVSSNSRFKTEKLSMYIFADKVKSAFVSQGYTVYLDPYTGGDRYNNIQTVKLLKESNGKSEEVVYLALHSNATGTSAKNVGPEVWYTKSSGESLKIAKSLCEVLRQIYTKNKMNLTGDCTFNGDGHLGEPKNFYADGGKGAAVLIEIGYHDNKINQDFIENNLELLAKGIVDGVNNYLNSK